MAQLLTFADDELPADLKCQILSAHRIQWPEGYVGENRLRDWIQHPRFHPVHFALVEGGVLVSYAGVVWKRLEHAGEAHKAYGLSGVYAYPAFRRQGHGRRVVDAATARIRRSNADVGLFTCAPNLTGFYAASGWAVIERAVLLGGRRDAPWPTEQRVMMGFFSEKGRRARLRFESLPISFDDELW